MRKNTAKDYAIALYQTIIDLKGEKLYTAIHKFAELLAKENKLKKSGKIVEEFLAYAKKQEGIVDIEITSARELDSKTIKEIESYFGESVETTNKIDKSLIGGVRVRTKDKIFDTSVRAQLSKLKQTII